MSEDLPTGKERDNAAARRRWRLGAQAIAILLLFAAGVGVILLESTSSDPTQKQVRALVAEIERQEADDWLSRLLREYFPKYGEGRGRYEVADELAALGAEAVPEIIAASGHNLSSVRYAAASALGGIGDRRAVAPLADLLSRDSDPDMRNEAASALSQIGGPEATACLIKAMADSEPKVRAAVAQALGEVGGPQATARLIAAMADSEPDVRKAVAEALGEIGDPAATDVLLRALGEQENTVLAAAAEAIGKVGHLPSLPRLIELLKDPAKDLRTAAARGLGEFGEPAAVEPLLGAMTDAEDKVREAAASALGQIVDPRAVPALVMALGDRSSGVRENAAQSLGLISDPRATEALVTAMRDDGSNVRFWAAVSLSSVDSPGAVEALLSAVTDKKDKSVRVVAAFALAIRKRPEAVPPLAAVLKSKSDWEAFGAVVGLGLVDSPEAQEALATVAGAPVSPAVRRLASRALQMPILTAMAKELREEDRELHYNICRAFVYLRDPASLPALEEALNSPDSDVRQAARKAIRQVRRTSQPQASSAPA